MHSGRLRLPARRLRLLALRALTHAPRRLRLLGMAFGQKCGGSAPTPHPRSRRFPAPASPSAPRATYRTQSQPVQFGNECRIRFPVDRDTGIQSTSHRIPLEGHRIENRTTYWWGLTVSHCYIKRGLKSALSGLKRDRSTFRYPCPDPLGLPFCHNVKNVTPLSSLKPVFGKVLVEQLTCDVGNGLVLLEGGLLQALAMALGNVDRQLYKPLR